MSRKLNSADISILYKLLPELKTGTSSPKYRSVLPPVSKFYVKSDEDFKARINKLSDDELEYIVDLILKGDECLRCIRNTHVGILFQIVSDRLSSNKANDLKELYEIVQK
ncbi:MAG: hypothetical protein ACLFMM_04895 [Methanohalobium sp.]|uniref:hypothetical protein n=1 Tax=Methanohalobium sp. TaxID=2837493 RepID=UPI003978B461